MKREVKKARRRFAFHAVHKGREENVTHEKWEDCEAFVKSFPSPVYKGFNHRVGAVDWLRGLRTKAAFELMMQEQAEALQSADNRITTNDDDQTIPVAKATLIPNAIPTATAVPVDPVTTTTTACERDFSPVAELARLIANAPVSGVSPPPKFTNPTCPHYTCGEVTHMQQMLLQRLCQTTFLTV